MLEAERGVGRRRGELAKITVEHVDGAVCKPTGKGQGPAVLCSQPEQDAAVALVLRDGLELAGTQHVVHRLLDVGLARLGSAVDDRQARAELHGRRGLAHPEECQVYQRQPVHSASPSPV